MSRGIKSLNPFARSRDQNDLKQDTTKLNQRQLIELKQSKRLSSCKSSFCARFIQENKEGRFLLKVRKKPNDVSFFLVIEVGKLARTNVRGDHLVFYFTLKESSHSTIYLKGEPNHVLVKHPRINFTN